MPSCFVPGCPNSLHPAVYALTGFKQGVSFHSFPVALKKKWLKALGKDVNFEVTFEKVCSEHFNERDFEIGGTRRRLREGVIPSLKLSLFINNLENVAGPSFSPKRTGRPTSTDSSPSSVCPKRSYSDSSSAHSSEKIKMIKLFHTYCKHPSEESKENCDIVEQLQERVALLEQQLKLCRSQLRIVKVTSKRRKQKISSVGKLLSDLKNKFSLSNQAAMDVTASMQGAPAALFKRFIKNKQAKGVSKITRVKFPKELRSFAMTLQFYSSKAYSFVREQFGYALPAPSTISTWLAKVDCTPGFSTPALSSLKIRAEEYFKRHGKQLICSLLMDEMAIKKELVCDRHTQELWGYTDIGTSDNIYFEKDLATEALVLMVVGVNDNFKLPVGYFFINSITGAEKANIVMEVLRQLHKTNCKILSVTCDGPQVNVKMMKSLGCKVTNPQQMKPYFFHPITHHRVYVIFDICHMLKLIRNNWARSKVFLDPNGEEIKWSYIEELHKLQANEGLYLKNKLRGKHIQWETAKMKVSIAAQTLSSSVADALEFLCTTLKLKEFEGVEPTVRFIRNIDIIFDLLNSRNFLGKGMKTPMLQKNETVWKPMLENIMVYLENCKTQQGRYLYLTKKRTPFLGFIVSSKSLLSIYEYEVVQHQTLKFILTYKFSQDHLELFFCSIRSRNGWINNPNAKQFMHTYKRLLVHQDVRSNTGNCIAQDQTNILVVSSKKEPITITDIHNSRNREISDMDEVEAYDEALLMFLPSELGEYAENVVGYISGFVVRSILKSLRCLPCAESLHMDETDVLDSSLEFTNFINKGGLMIASRSVRLICMKVEKKIQLIKKLSGTLLPEKRKIINVLMRETVHICESPNIFTTLEHTDMCEVTDFSHKTLLIQKIIRCYASLRLHSLTRDINFSVKGKNIRQIMNKLVLFKNQ